MRIKKPPKIGDRIRHEEPEFDRVTEGVVTIILSCQFIYETDKGYTKFCFFKDLWEKTNNDPA